jgi:hypothetical protein
MRRTKPLDLGGDFFAISGTGSAFERAGAAGFSSGAGAGVGDSVLMGLLIDVG